MGKIRTISVLLFTFKPKLFAVVVSTNRICIKNYAGIEHIVFGAMLLCVCEQTVRNLLLGEYQANVLLETFTLQLIYREHWLPGMLHSTHKLNGACSTLSLMMKTILTSFSVTSLGTYNRSSRNEKQLCLQKQRSMVLIIHLFSYINILLQ